MLYSKNGSIPQEQTDGTDGWIEVPDKPETPEGKEVVWWYPPGWVIRDPKPVERDGYVWSWSQSSEQWVECELPKVPTVEVNLGDIPSLTSGDITSLTTDQISALE